MDDMSKEVGRAPTRRSLREQRRSSESAAGGHDREHMSGRQPVTGEDPNASEDTNELNRVARANRSRRAADVPFDMVPEREEASDPGERSSLQRARDREALRARRDASAQRDTNSSGTHAPADEPAPVTRRQLRLQALAAARTAAQERDPAAAEEGAPPPESGRDAPGQDSLSVEEALEARRHRAAGQPGDEQLPAREGDEQDDLEVLAQQRELAARAAIISRRVAARERLKRAHSTRDQDGPAGDPFTGAMDRLRREEAERDLANTGINAPQTSGFHLELPGTGKTAGIADTVREPAREANVEAAGGQVAAGPATEKAQNEEPRQPISARTAQGLDPLDYRTAGVQRANIWAWAVLGVLLVGAAALVTGVVMITTNG